MDTADAGMVEKMFGFKGMLILDNVNLTAWLALNQFWGFDADPVKHQSI